MLQELSFAVVQGLVTGAMYGLFALGIVLVYRGTRVINFAAPAIGSVGLYITSVLTQEHGVAWLTAAVIGLLVAGAISLAFERFVVRRMHDASPLSIAVATIGLMLLIISTELVLFGGSPRNLAAPIGGRGFDRFGIQLSPTNILAIVVAITVGLALSQFLRRTDFGLGVQAAAMDSQAVRLVGVRLNDVNMFVWAVGGMIAVVAAVLVLPSIGGFQPGTVTGTFFVPALAAALLGGLDEMGGAFAGGLAIGLVIELTKFAFLGGAAFGPQYLALLAVIILVLVLAPGGLTPHLRRLRGSAVAS